MTTYVTSSELRKQLADAGFKPSESRKTKPRYGSSRTYATSGFQVWTILRWMTQEMVDAGWPMVDRGGYFVDGWLVAEYIDHTVSPRLTKEQLAELRMQLVRWMLAQGWEPNPKIRDMWRKVAD